MRSKLRRREFIAFLFVSLWGVIGHFIFDWSGENPFLGAIFAVNESTWEHMKLLYLPLFLFAMLEYISLGESIGNFFAARFAAALLGLAASFLPKKKEPTAPSEPCESAEPTEAPSSTTDSEEGQA